MADTSIKKRLGGSHLGGMNEGEIRQLLSAILTDLTNLRASVTTLRTDVINVQTSANNLATDCNNYRTQLAAVIVDIVKVNCNTGSANNTAPITAVAPTAVTGAAATVSTAAPGALTLTA